MLVIDGLPKHNSRRCIGTGAARRDGPRLVRPVIRVRPRRDARIPNRATHGPRRKGVPSPAAAEAGPGKTTTTNPSGTRGARPCRRHEAAGRVITTPTPRAASPRR